MTTPWVNWSKHPFPTSFPLLPPKIKKKEKIPFPCLLAARVSHMAQFGPIKCKYIKCTSAYRSLLGREFWFLIKEEASEESLLVPVFSPSCLNADVMSGAEAAIFGHEEDKHKNKMSKCQGGGTTKKAGILTIWLGGWVNFTSSPPLTILSVWDKWTFHCLNYLQLGLHLIQFFLADPCLSLQSCWQEWITFAWWAVGETQIPPDKVLATHRLRRTLWTWQTT